MPLDVTILEVPARFGAMEAQLQWIQTALDAQAPGAVLVLPEAALTGYVSGTGDFDLTPFAEPLEGRQLEALRGLARRYDTTVIGPVIEREEGRCFNAQLVVAPGGDVRAHYRKRHPWYPETWATPGDQPFSTFELGGLRATLAICFDVHFLADEAADALETSDVLFFCSAWVDDAGDSRPGHLMPLARQFSVQVVNANWGPGDPHVPGQGGSLILGPRGELVERTKPGEHRLDVALSKPRASSRAR
jgi:predicted amidohydrolase